ncbi:complement activation [Mactra antiquata]
MPNLATFENSARSIHSDIRDWPEEIAGGCYQHDCPPDKMCYPIATNFTCISIDCGLPPQVHLAVINTTSTFFGNNETVECLPGYILYGPRTMRCQADKQWSEKPYCLPVNCGSPFVENGFVESGMTTYGNTADVFCDFGYLVNGTNAIICQTNGVWSDAECIVADCGDPEVDNSVYVGDNTSYGAQVDIICDVGYNLDGMRTIQCQATGNWSTKPQCVIVVICIDDVCFRAYSGIMMSSYTAFTYDFTVVSTINLCVQYCQTNLPGYKGINYNPLDDFCRCLSVSLEEYANAGYSYGTGTNYDLYEPIS